jgi:hypothetical protein
MTTTIKVTDLENPPPVLTPAEHLLNICTLAGAMLVASQPESLGDDAIIAYDRILVAYQKTNLPTS